MGVEGWGEEGGGGRWWWIKSTVLTIKAFHFFDVAKASQQTDTCPSKVTVLNVHQSACNIKVHHVIEANPWEKKNERKWVRFEGWWVKGDLQLLLKPHQFQRGDHALKMAKRERAQLTWQIVIKDETNRYGRVKACHPAWADWSEALQVI